MKFLVLGASGMAGHIICIYLKEQGHDVTGFSRREIPFVKSICADARDTKKLEDLILTGGFDAVINAVGILNKFAEEDKASAVFLNGYLPHFLASVTKDTQTQIIHMSTDCVFSGHSGPYTEESICDGTTFYDRTKAIGELNDEKNITLRCSIVGPDINKNVIGLLNWFMQQDKAVRGYTHAMWTGVTTLQLAKIMEAAAERKAHGLVNMVYNRNISKYELLKLFNHYMRNDELDILPFDDFSVDKTLIRTNFDFDYSVPSYDDMVSELADWMRAHGNLYPHYKI